MISRAHQTLVQRAPLPVALLLALLTLAATGPAARATERRPGYPAGATRAQIRPTGAELARLARAARKHAKKQPKKKVLRGDPARALLAFEALQSNYYIRGSGLYEGEPFSFLWPFSQAFGATVGMAEIPALKGKLNRELHARLIGLASYLDTDNSGAPEGVYTSTLAAYDGTVAPPAGPGGTKFYDDNDWVGIELMRLYELKREPAVLGAAEGIMAFEMQGWQSSPELACSGGLPFSNSVENRTRNTIATAPAAELGVQLYRATGRPEYLQFAQMAYQWVRDCLLEPGSDLYAGHLNRRGIVQHLLWSYTQGAMIGAGALLYQATGQAGYIYEARQTAAAALAYFTPARLGTENPFFVFVYFRNLMYLDSITHDQPGPKLAQAYVDYAWSHLRLPGTVFVSGDPPSGNVLTQAVYVQLYALLSSPPSTFF